MKRISLALFLLLAGSRVYAAPSVVTLSPTEISQTSARLHGTVTSDGSFSLGFFEWGTSPALGMKTPDQTLPSGTSPISINAVIAPLSCGTTYYYHAVGQNTQGTGFGAALSFSTSPCVGSAPTAATLPADQVTDRSARFLGEANPNGQSTQAYFEWGQTTGYGSSTVAQSLGSGSSTVPVQHSIQGLHCSLNYNFRLVTENSGGVTRGQNQTFRTQPCAGSHILTVTIQGNGSVTSDPAGMSCPATCSVSFEAGLFVELRPSPGAGSVFTRWEGDPECADGVVPMTTARSCTAVFSGGGVPVIVVTGNPEDVSASTARFVGTVTSDGSPTAAFFRWGKTTSYGQQTLLQTLAQGTAPRPIEATVTGLECNTTYHVKAVASNSQGNGEGQDRSFTTRECLGSAPQATTNAADAVTGTSARLNGLVHPGGQATQAYFEWGQTTSYGTFTPPQSIASGAAAMPVQQSLAGLHCGLTYHFRMVAENTGGFSRGSDQSFRTTACTEAKRLTVAIEGSGTVTSDPAGMACPGACSELFESSLTVRLRPAAAAGWTFDSWLGDSECADGMLPMTADRSCTARFRTAAPQEHRLTIEKTGDGTGTVSSTPAGINCGSDCSQDYQAGTVVQLEASPNGSSTFEGWSGHSDCSDGSVTMTSARTCRAAFKEASSRKYTLRIDRSGSGQGTVTSSPAGINCGSDCSESYSEGQKVALSATPAAGSTFAGWSGDSDCKDGQVTMNDDRDCKATFNSSASSRYTLTVIKSGTGSGTISSNPSGINCGSDCSEKYNSGKGVSLTAKAASGSNFAGWSGHADCADGNVTMTADKSCTATFSTGTLRTLNILKAGNGAGRVTSSPSGIDCGSDCSETYSSSKTVTLNAVASSGSVFAGWSGHSDCSDGVVTTSSSKSCTATFNLASCSSPGAFSLSGPGSSAVDVGTSPTFSWGASAGAGRYILHIGETSPPSSANDQTVLGTSASPLKRLLPGQTYYWSVEAVAACDPARKTLNTGGVRSFTTAKVRVFLIHGIGQSGSAMASFGINLISPNGGIDRSRALVNSSFDWSECDDPNCPSSCTLAAGAAKLARRIAESSPPAADLILVGYSMGGLLARQMLVDNPQNVLAGRYVRGLVTLGTPNGGYPYCNIDGTFACSHLARDMASHLRLSGSPYYSVALQGLNQEWSALPSSRRPERWLAVAGTNCRQSPLTDLVGVRVCEFRGVRQGCPDADDRESDGVVCRRSALFETAQGNGPTFTLPDPDYRHTNLPLWRSIGMHCPDSGLILFDPPTGDALFTSLRAFIDSRAVALSSAAEQEDLLIVEESADSDPDLAGLGLDVQRMRQLYVWALNNPGPAARILAPIVEEAAARNLWDERSRKMAAVLAYLATPDAVAVLSTATEDDPSEGSLLLRRSLYHATSRANPFSLIYSLLESGAAGPEALGVVRDWLAETLVFEGMPELLVQAIQERGLEPGILEDDPLVRLLPDTWRNEIVKAPR